MLIAFFAVLGLILGSFATVVAYRVGAWRVEAQKLYDAGERDRKNFPRISLGGRSRCPSCGAQIRALDNIPLFSYLLVLRGRCRHCGYPISPRYPLIEAATAVLFALAAHKFGLDWELPVYAAFMWVLVVLSAVDIETRYLPDVIVLPSLLIGGVVIAVLAVSTGGLDQLAQVGLGALLFGGLINLPALINPSWMGGGDAKLSWLLGAFLGYLGAPGIVLVGMFMAFAGGALFSVGLMIAGRAGRKSQVGFGPFLALGTVVGVFAGRPVVDWYLDLLS